MNLFLTWHYLFAMQHKIANVNVCCKRTLWLAINITLDQMKLAHVNFNYVCFTISTLKQSVKKIVNNKTEQRKCILGFVGSDPVQKVRHLGVDAGVLSIGATVAPRDDAVLDGIGTGAREQRATRVTLARVDAT